MPARSTNAGQTSRQHKCTRNHTKVSAGEEKPTTTLLPKVPVLEICRQWMIRKKRERTKSCAGTCQCQKASDISRRQRSQQKPATRASDSAADSVVPDCCTALLCRSSATVAHALKGHARLL